MQFNTNVLVIWTFVGLLGYLLGGITAALWIVTVIIGVGIRIFYSKRK